jgi:hypothetical protein
MKIFIGGVKRPNPFMQRWPEQEFEFATEDETPAAWVRKAMRCDQHLVYKHRTTHTHTEALAKQNITPYFTDSTPIVMGIIERLIAGNDKGAIHELLAMWE